MLKISKLTLIAAVAAITVAAPALAQSFNPRDGTGNVMPLQYQADGGRNAWTAPQADVQVAARKNGGSEQIAVRKNGNTQQIAARKGGNSVKIAAHRAAHHGAA
jgi:hypothetical protein